MTSDPPSPVCDECHTWRSVATYLINLHGGRAVVHPSAFEVESLAVEIDPGVRVFRVFETPS